MKLFEKTILVTHAPPHKTKLDEMREGYHVGNKSIREFIEKAKPSVAVSGHIHETFEKVDKIGETVIVNPGPGGAIIDI
jgi:Icc-related predicted phosphoesterase